MRRTTLALAALALVACRASGPDLGHVVYRVEARVVEGPPSIADGVRGADGGLVVSATRVDALRGLAGVDMISTPRILVREGRKAEISNVSTHDYVQDVTVSAQGVVEPVHGKVEQGFWIAVVPRPTDGGRIELEADVRTSDLVLPIRTEVVRPAGADREVTLELPEVSTQRLASKLAIGPGEAGVVVLRAPDAGGAQRVRVIALTCETVRTGGGQQPDGGA